MTDSPRVSTPSSANFLVPPGSPGLLPLSSSKPKYIVGVCAMDNKARSRPMRNILNKLFSYGEYEIVIFGDKVILDEDVENWPGCDFLISFFSQGFPFEKALKYITLRKPFCINDLQMQELLMDRRMVLSALDALGVPTPRRLIVNRDGGPKPSPILARRIKNAWGIDLAKHLPEDEAWMLDPDTISISGHIMKKPFVEKPASGEDHNVYIYFSQADGGGGRKLFRKVANKSSEFTKDLSIPRSDGSYIYEEFLNVDKAEDIKVYTIGPDYTHAETRKSPVVDGLVRRNTDGKELRYITELSPAEKIIARKVCNGFGQMICGFDLLRVGSKSYVIDVNGWSFVKGNDDYYDNCARIMSEMFNGAAKKRRYSVTDWLPKELLFENSWRLKGFISIFRHADRTPKQKMKFSFRSAPFVQLLDGGDEEIILRLPHQLKLVADATAEAIQLCSEEADKLQQLEEILNRKSELPGTKVQIKPSHNKITGELEKLQLIVKWGGEFTHAARYQSRDLGGNLHKDMTLMNRSVLDDVKIYTSSERRVTATADIFASTFLDKQVIPPNTIISSKEMLDDSNAAKELMDAAKAKIREFVRPSVDPDSYKDLNWPKDLPAPYKLVEEATSIMKIIRENMRDNFSSNTDVDNIQPRWCCNESPMLFRERWEKLFKDWLDVEPENFDASKIPELYDSMKYDALHNRAFIEGIFSRDRSNKDETIVLFKELYRKARILFDFVSPQEYGITKEEKLEIGLLTSLPLLKNIIRDMEEIRDADRACTRLYFTKESHVHTLLNVVLLSGLPTNSYPPDLELDYLSQITFELYERNRTVHGDKEYSLRLSLSPGAHYPNVLDLQLDAKHCLSVAARRNLTDHLPLDEALSYYKAHLTSPKMEKIEKTIIEKRTLYLDED